MEFGHFITTVYFLDSEDDEDTANMVDGNFDVMDDEDVDNYDGFSKTLVLLTDGRYIPKKYQQIIKYNLDLGLLKIGSGCA